MADLNAHPDTSITWAADPDHAVTEYRITFGPLAGWSTYGSYIVPASVLSFALPNLPPGVCHVRVESMVNRSPTGRAGDFVVTI